MLFNKKNKANKKLNLLSGSTLSQQLFSSACIFSGFVVTFPCAVMADEYFNPALLRVGNDQATAAGIADLEHFQSGGQAPGVYHVSLYLNNRFIDNRDVTFATGKNNELLPQLTIGDLALLGVSINAVPSLADLPDDSVVTDLRESIPAAVLDFQFSQQRLNVSIPQVLVKRRAADEVDPGTWNQGISAALLNYALSGNQTRDLQYGRGRSETLYANLRGGLNLGPWRLRSYASYQQRKNPQKGRSQTFDLISTYLQRDIHSIKGRLTLGDSVTDGDVFDSVQFQGGQIVSDDSMLPDSLRGFAPVVRGVSESGAEITVRQNGSIIYQSYVPPGPFEIDDLYPASLSGDLVITVKESDGRERSFTQPYSSIAIMQREGQLKYAMALGQLRNRAGSLGTGTARFIQGTLIYGLPGSATVYGGVQLAKQFVAGSVGLGLGMGRFGAVSADVTHSNTTLLNGDKSQGQSYRLRYSRSMIETGTSVSLAAYRYSTEGYYNLQDAFTEPSRGVLNSQYRPRGEFQVMLNQSLGDAGSMYVSGSQRNYWNKTGELRTWSVGYNNNLWGVSYGINLSQSQDTESGRQDRRVALSASVPLSRWLSGDQGYSRNNMQLNYGLNHSHGQGAVQQLGLSGSALEGNQLSYNLSQTTGRDSRASSLNVAYRGSKTSVSAGYNRSHSQEQVNYSLRGGIVAHPYGVTLAPEMNDTVALIRAPGASDLMVNNRAGLVTDRHGYAVMPLSQPYRRSEISLDPSGLGSNLALNKTSVSVTPTRGAVVLANFPTKRGHQVMMRLRQANGAMIPFGATARLVGIESGEPNTGIVGEEGLLYMSGMPDKGMLEIQWGKGGDASCLVPFTLQEADGSNNNSAPLQVRGECKKA